jgi:hypothetical protein
MKRISLTTLLLLLLIVPFTSITAQEKSRLKPEIGCDIVSSYIWRGSAIYSALGEQNVLSPSFQPGFSVNYKGFELGTWGSVDFTGTYKELDNYLGYSYKGLTATITDYYWAADWIVDNYFDYQSDSTSHYLEACLSYKGVKIPFSIVVATMVYGADKKFEDHSQNNYSTYIEAGYSIPVKGFTIDLFLGITPMDGFYGDGYGGKAGFAVVNTGVSGSKVIPVTEKFSLPVKASVIANPQARKLYLVFALTI